MSDAPGFNPNSQFGQAIKQHGMDRPDVPAKQYDEFRERYFNTRVAPRLQPEQREKKRQEFLTRTQRPKLPTSEYAETLARITAESAFVPPEKTAGAFSSFYRKRAAGLEQDVAEQRQKLAWHGQMGGGVAEFTGGMTGYAAELAALGGVAKGALKAFPAAAELYESSKAVKMVTGAWARSLGFGALMAAEATPGHRTSDFAKGTGWGIGGEMMSSVLGRLWSFYKGRKGLPSPKQIDEFQKQMARGEVSTEPVFQDMDKALAQDVTEAHSQKGYLSHVETTIDEKASKPRFVFEDGKGNSFMAQTAVTDLEKAYKEIESNLNQGRILRQVHHDSVDAEAVNELLSKLKERYDPQPLAMTLAGTTAEKGVNAGGGTARVDGKVFKYRYATTPPGKLDAMKFIKGAGIESQSLQQGALKDFDTVWNPFRNWMARAEAADRLEANGLTDLIPTPEVRARWKTAEAFNLPKKFNEKGWYEWQDNWIGKDEEGNTQKLSLLQRQHLSNALKVVWDPTIPPESAMFQSSLAALKRYDIPSNFFPGGVEAPSIGPKLASTGTRQEWEASARRFEAERAGAAKPTSEHLYTTIQKLAERYAQEKAPDFAYDRAEFGTRTVDAAIQMAAKMWDYAKGDASKVIWDESTVRMGVREGILPRLDALSLPERWWYMKGEDHLAERFGTQPGASEAKAALDSKVLKLAEAYNVDPKNIDAELLAEVGEEEVARAVEIAEKAKATGKSVYDQSVWEEMRRLGKFEEPSFALKEIPESERPSYKPGEPSGHPDRMLRMPDGTVGSFVYRLTRAKSGLPSRLYVLFDDNVVATHKSTGTNMMRDGLHWLEQDWPQVAIDVKAIGDKNGIDFNNVPVTTVWRPNLGLKHTASTLWHEDLHGMIGHINVGKLDQPWKSIRVETNLALRQIKAALPSELAKTWDDLETALTHRFGDAYESSIRREEAFVHAATAIRWGKADQIAHFATIDTSVERVYETVQAIAAEMRRAAGEMAPGAAKNVIMDRLGFISNFSNVDRYKALKEVAEGIFAEAGGDVNLLNRLTSSVHYENFYKLLSAGEQGLEARTFSPNYTAWGEAAGVRGALYPNQFPPGKTPPPMPDNGIEEGWNFVGWEAIRGAFTPVLSWTGEVDKKLNAKFAEKGTYFPLLDRVRAVDEAYRAGNVWLDENRKSAAEFLKGGAQKLESYFLMLSKEQSKWPALAQKLGLENDDIARLKLAEQWLKDFQNDTHVPVFNYLRDEWGKLAQWGYDTQRVYGSTPLKADKMSTFHRLITEGQLNPRDTHLGRFINLALREGMEKKFTGEALKGLRQVVNMKGEDGKYILGSLRYPLERYHDYMKGIPDTSGRVINRFVGDLQNSLLKQFKRLNQHLPAGYRLPEEMNYPSHILQRMMIFSYAAGIGGRPAIAIRDAMQGVALSLPIMGPKAFFNGLGRAMTREGWQESEKAGALLRKMNVGDLFGDLFEELPVHKGNKLDKAQQIAAAILAPSRWGHNVARRSVYSGAASEGLSAVNAFRKLAKPSLADEKKLLEDTGLWFADKGRQNQILSMVKDKYLPAKEVAKHIGLEMVDLTLWPYRRGTQPYLLQTGLGRVFGQYGLWPMNFLDYLQRMVTKIPEHPKKAIPALATWLAVQTALVETAKNAFGIDVARWFGVSPAGFTGSPHAQFVHDIATALKEDDEGRKARKRVMQYPLQFVPAWNEIHAVAETWDEPMFDDEGKPTQAFLKVMGFRPTKPGEPTLDQLMSGDVAPAEFAKHELGLKK